MTLLYRSQQLNRSHYSTSSYLSEEEEQRRLNEKHMKKFGHPFLKPYEPGDEHRFFLPERSYDDYIVYHRYTIYKTQMKCSATLCYCYQSGSICPTCAPLNTSWLFDLKVPLDPERFTTMKTILHRECGLSTAQIYNWLSFWIHDVISKRFSYDVSTPYFFHYRSSTLQDKIRTPYSFMGFLYTFLKNKEFQKRFTDFNFRWGDKPSFERVSDDVVCIRTVKALVKWSLEVYKHDGYIIQCRTNYRKYISMFTRSSHQDYDCFSRRLKKQFDVCLHQIREEVAYRPGMVGMLSTQEEFARKSQLLV